MCDYLYSVITEKHKGLIASIIKFFLFCLSLIYLELLSVMHFCYRLKIFKIHKLPCKVISVGNITLGGTGKTPLTEFIVKYLLKQNYKVAVLTRGYKREAPPKSMAGMPRSLAEMGDEPYLLKQKLNTPVIVDANRKRGAEFAKKEFNIDTVVLDDGFQQFSICKDLNILTIDSLNPFGNYMVIPRGVLREPLVALGRADIIILTKSNLVKKEDVESIIKFIFKFNRRALILEAEYGLTFPDIKENKVSVLTSIAAPDSFKKMLLVSGFDIALEMDFPDHYCFEDKDIDKIIGNCAAKRSKVIFTTEKDWVRLERFKPKLDNSGIKIFVLPLVMKIKNEERLFSRLRSIYLD